MSVSGGHGGGDGSGGGDGLVDAIVALGRELPHVVLADIAAELEALPAGVGQAGLARIAGRAGKLAMRASARERLLELCARWQRERPGVAPAALAWAMRAASATDDWHRRSQRLSLIWTGPRQLEPPARRTDQALLELIERARRAITIVTFAAYRIERIHQALVKKADQGVTLTFIVESPEDSRGELRSDPRQAIGSELMQRAHVLVWPPEQRKRDERGRPGVLHAKCAIADAHWLLLSSANVTARAMDVNMELGVLIEGGDLPRVVTAHFDALITEGVLQRLV